MYVFVHVCLFGFLSFFVFLIYCLFCLLCNEPSWSDFIIKMMVKIGDDKYKFHYIYLAQNLHKAGF